MRAITTFGDLNHMSLVPGSPRTLVMAPQVSEARPERATPIPQLALVNSPVLD